MINQKWYKGKSILTLWDISEELYGNADFNNFIKVRGAFLELSDTLEEGVDYITAPREHMKEKFGIVVFRQYGRIKTFPLLTISGAHEVLDILGFSDSREILDEYFGEDKIELIEDAPIEIHRIKKLKRLDRIVLKEETPVVLTPTIVVPVVNDGNISVFSEGMLSLISYITTSRALFHREFSDITVGTIVFDIYKNTLRVISNITIIPAEIDNDSSVTKFLIESVDIIYSGDRHKWIVGDTSYLIKDLGMGTEELNILSLKGVDFMLALKTEEKTLLLNSALVEIKDLAEKKRDAQTKMDQKIASLFTIGL